MLSPQARSANPSKKTSTQTHRHQTLLKKTALRTHHSAHSQTYQFLSLFRFFGLCGSTHWDRPGPRQTANVLGHASWDGNICRTSTTPDMQTWATSERKTAQVYSSQQKYVILVLLPFNSTHYLLIDPYYQTKNNLSNNKHIIITKGASKQAGTCFRIYVCEQRLRDKGRCTYTEILVYLIA